MPSLTRRVAEVRTRRPLVDHAVRMQEHYGAVKASQQAGAVTYFAFLSVFPILALSFFVVGWIARVYPGVRGDLRHAINGLLPHLVGPDDGQIKIQDIQSAAAAVDVEEAMRAASAIGDDTIQRRTQGRIVPDSFTHGTSEQRTRWFMTGMKSGQISVCNTFEG